MASREEIAVVATLRDDVSRGIRAIRGNLNRLERSHRLAAGAAGRQGRAMGALETSMHRTGRATRAIASSLGGIFVTAARTAAVGLGALTVGAVAFGVRAASSFEQTQTALEGLLGSAAEGQRVFSELQQFNLKTPFGLDALTGSARQLAGFGFGSSEILALTKSAANAAAALGAGEEGLQRIVLNLGQVRAAGKVTGRELRDFATVGFPGYELVAHILGKSREEIRAMGDDAEVSADQFLAAVTSMAGPLARFEGMAARQADTLAGRWSNIKDLLQVGLAGAAMPLLATLEPLLDTENGAIPRALKGLVENVGRPLMRIAGLFADLFARAVPVIEPLLSALVGGLESLTEAAMPGLQGLKPVVQELVRATGDFFTALVPHMPDLVDAFVAIVALTPEMVGFLTALTPLIGPLARLVTHLAEMGPLAAGALVAVLGWSKITAVFGAIKSFIGLIRGATASLLGLQAAQSAGSLGAAGVAGAGRIGLAGLGLAGVGAGGAALGIGAGVAGGAALGTGLHRAGVEPLGGGATDWFSRNITPHLPEWLGGLNARDRSSLDRGRPNARPEAAAIAAMVRARPQTNINLPAGAVVVNSPSSTVDFEKGLASGLARYERERQHRR